jgi:D-alanine-D-alanine ligase
VRITVLLGGTSAERDVSLATGVRVARALRERGHDVAAIDTARGALTAGEEQRMLAGQVVKTIPPDVEALAELDRRLPARLDALRDTDVVFLALHGGRGEDGTLQALLDLTGVPYTGSGHLASALAMDKDLSKRLFRSAGVPTADWLMWRALPGGSPPLPSADEVERELGWPVVVKPSKQGSTVGLAIVREPGELEGAIREAARFDDEVMIERFVPGRELTVGILGGEPLPVGEIIPVHEIYDYECKYTPGMAREVFPAELSDEETAAVQELARRAFEALKLGGCARIDFRMAPDGTFYCLEANTLPGMTATSLIPQAAAAAGISFEELCERIVKLAVRDPESR